MSFLGPLVPLFLIFGDISYIKFYIIVLRHLLVGVA